MAALEDHECGLRAATKIERWWLIWNRRPTEGSDDVAIDASEVGRYAGVQKHTL